MSTPKKRKRGFSLIEIVVALGLVGVFATLSLPLVSRTMRRNELRKAARTVHGALGRTRSLAVSGRRVATTWAPTDRTVSAILRITGSTSYEVFVDRDTTTDGDELSLGTTNLPLSLTFDAPATGEEIRFRSDGTVVAPLDLVLRDRELDQTRRVVLTAGGLAHIE
ncbi:GspH/FimT family protein [Myxococcota bacterium]|nr:GspH/FimT family protein [Myxococcota bacterium]